MSAFIVLFTNLALSALPVRNANRGANRFLFEYGDFCFDKIIICDDIPSVPKA